MIESGSSLSVFLTCPKKYEFSYEKLLGSPYYRQALGYGTFIHAGIEIMSGKGRENIMDNTLYEMLEFYKSDADREQIRADYELAKKVVRLWTESWGQTHPFGNQELEWKESEFEWSYNIPETDFVHVGKSDGIVRHKKYDKLFLYELKTAADRGRDSYVHRLMVDKQISSNLIALRARDIDVEGVIYDIVWKPGLIRGKNRKTMPDETLEKFGDRIFGTMKDEPHKYFERHIVYRNSQDIAEYERDLRHQFEALYIAKKKKAFYRNSNACDDYGLCEFFSSCIEGKAEMEELLHKRELRLPELSKDVQ